MEGNHVYESCRRDWTRRLAYKVERCKWELLNTNMVLMFRRGWLDGFENRFLREKYFDKHVTLLKLVGRRLSFYTTITRTVKYEMTGVSGKVGIKKLLGFDLKAYI